MPKEPPVPQGKTPAPRDACMQQESSRGTTAPVGRNPEKEERTDAAVQSQEQTDRLPHPGTGGPVEATTPKGEESTHTNEEKRDRSKEEPCEKSHKEEEAG